MAHRRSPRAPRRTPPDAAQPDALSPGHARPLEPEADPEEARRTDEFTRLLIEFYERFSSWELDVVRGTGITLQQMHTLEILGSGGEMRMKELAGKMSVTTGSLTVLVDRLVRAGLVERSPNPQDRRSIQVGLTPEGRRLFEEHHALHGQLSQDMAGALAPEELPRFMDMLSRVVARL